jgi:hypothetical protein
MQRELDVEAIKIEAETNALIQKILSKFWRSSPVDYFSFHILTAKQELLATQLSLCEEKQKEHEEVLKDVKVSLESHTLCKDDCDTLADHGKSKENISHFIATSDIRLKGIQKTLLKKL